MLRSTAVSTLARTVAFVLMAVAVVGCASSERVRVLPQEKPNAGKESKASKGDPMAGMRYYPITFIYRNPEWKGTAKERSALGAGHMKNINKLAAAGKLIIAGPFGRTKVANEMGLAGLFIWDATKTEDARKWAATDPAIAAGLFTVKTVAWFGPKGLTYAGRDEELAKLRAEAEASGK